MKPLRFVPDNTNIKFMKVARPGFIASIGAVLASIVLFFTVSLNYGIDFTGGTEILVRPTAENAQTLNIDEMRGIVGGLGLGSTELQEFGTDGDVAIRIGLQDGGEEAQQAAVAKVREAFGDKVEYRAVNSLGSKVSGELARDGLLAILLSFMAIMIYIWLRFEWQFAIGTVATLVHDVALTVGLLCILRVQFDLTSIAAILDHRRLFAQRHRGGVRPVPRELAQIQEDAVRPDGRHVAEPDAAAHLDDVDLHAGGAWRALRVRR
jgi:preprotein translocase subunit SecF